jgi:amino-acid N-acetyltransferase
VGRLDDVAAIEALLTAAHLPARLIAEFIDNFLVAEQEGRVVAAGCFEVYEDTAVLRSVVVDEPLRGSGLGKEIAELLMEKTRAGGAADLYLFTIDSAPFWLKLGFEEIPMTSWRLPARQFFQWRFVMQNLERFRERGIHSMWRRA